MSLLIVTQSPNFVKSRTLPDIIYCTQPNPHDITMSERSSNNTAPSVNRPVEDTQSGTGSEAPTLLDIWPWADNPSEAQLDFVLSNLTPTAQTSLSVLQDRILNTESARELDEIGEQVHSLFISEAARISLDARRAAASGSQQETTRSNSATPSASNNPPQDGTIRPDAVAH